MTSLDKKDSRSSTKRLTDGHDNGEKRKRRQEQKKLSDEAAAPNVIVTDKLNQALVVIPASPPLPSDDSAGSLFASTSVATSNYLPPCLLPEAWASKSILDLPLDRADMILTLRREGVRFFHSLEQFLNHLGRGENASQETESLSACDGVVYLSWGSSKNEAFPMAADLLARAARHLSEGKQGRCRQVIFASSHDFPSLYVEDWKATSSDSKARVFVGLTEGPSLFPLEQLTGKGSN